MNSPSLRAVVKSSDRLKETPVKNLGWLLRHWKDVESFRVTGPQFQGNAAHLVAELGDGRCFEVDFADKSVLWTWLGRPVFNGRTLDWFGRETLCGSVFGPPEETS